jgi:hypothetical protein
MDFRILNDFFNFNSENEMKIGEQYSATFQPKASVARPGPATGVGSSGMGQWGWGMPCDGKERGGVRPRPASGAPAGSGPRPAGAAMPRGRCECGWTGETGTDAWAPTTQCRAVATVQFFFKSIQLILNDFKPSKLQPTQKGLS